MKTMMYTTLLLAIVPASVCLATIPEDNSIQCHHEEIDFRLSTIVGGTNFISTNRNFKTGDQCMLLTCSHETVSIKKSEIKINNFKTSEILANGRYIKYEKPMADICPINAIVKINAKKGPNSSIHIEVLKKLKMVSTSAEGIDCEQGCIFYTLALSGNKSAVVYPYNQDPKSLLSTAASLMDLRLLGNILVNNYPHTPLTYAAKDQIYRVAIHFQYRNGGHSIWSSDVTRMTGRENDLDDYIKECKAKD